MSATCFLLVTFFAAKAAPTENLVSPTPWRETIIFGNQAGRSDIHEDALIYWLCIDTHVTFALADFGHLGVYDHKPIHAVSKVGVDIEIT